MPTNVRYVKYRCRNPQCLAEDTAKFFEHEAIPAQPLNCWRCGAGRQMDPNQMIAQGIGMWPLPAEEQPVEAPPESAPPQPS